MLVEWRSWLDRVVVEVFVGIGSFARCAAHCKFYQSSIKYLNLEITNAITLYRNHIYQFLYSLVFRIFQCGIINIDKLLCA